jgi:hypothetical protein
MNKENPYRAPVASEAGPLTASAIKKATNLCRDARLAVAVAFIPLLGLVFILRVVQWYLLRKQFPSLVTDDTELGRDFRSSISRLWFAVLMWPIAIILIAGYLYLN